MCGNTECTYQESCTTRATKTVGQSWAKTTVTVELKCMNTGGKKGYKDFWDATEEIINQFVLGRQYLSGT
ncbi:uncharacterized protein FTOL_06522 [Fusarium torulosum]|uniref:Uncharacterized protein n=1 Tax=Fusarium torulosum TaxID=33205 RepID=A0AAE8M9Y5_9HYPO|nr:uncharacterized protein FTOL_06522 [Fusarium torulosum]